MTPKMALNFLLCILLNQELVIYSQQASFFEDNVLYEPVSFGNREVRSLPEYELKNFPKRTTRTTKTLYATKLSQQRDEVQVGADVKVTCTGSSANIIWLNANNKTVVKDTHVKTKFIKASNSSELKFSKVQMDQMGVYSCNDTKYGGASYYTLLVYTLPTVKLSPSKTVHLEEGENEEIKCAGNSPNITWKNPHGSLVPAHQQGLSTVRTLLNPQTNTSTLILTNATAWQKGVYTCTVGISGRSKEEKITVEVQPVQVQFFPDPGKTVHVKENTDYDIDCEGNVKSITWMLHGKEISTNKRDDIYMKATEHTKNKMTRKLKFEDVQKVNEGTYVCSAISAFNGSKIERSFDLKVTETNTLSKPKITKPEEKTRIGKVSVLVNGSLELNCKGDTEQVEWLGPPHYWKIEGKPGEDTISVEKIKSKKVALRFARATLENAGIYKCRVSKRKIEEDSEIEITVVEPSSIDEFGPKKYIEKENGTVRLICSVHGHPKPTVTWYFNSKPIQITEGSRYHSSDNDLHIKNITYKDAGKYVCQATQSISLGSTAERAVELEVLHKPYFPQGNITVERLPLPSDTIECKCNANPYPTEFSWYINDTTSLSNKLPFLGKEIPVNSSELFGDYICAVSNEYGSNLQKISVRPMMFPSIPELTVFDVKKEKIDFKLKSERNDTIILFNIEYKAVSEEEWIDKNETKGTSWDYIYTLDDLEENTEYVMKARSLNVRGFSNFSAEMKFNTSTSFATRLSASCTTPLSVILILLYSCSILLS